MTSTPPATSVFQMPSDGPTYIEQVRSRCQDMIQCGIWAGLHIQKLNQWWSNFHSEVERYFAACLLDSIIYRSEDQTIALMRQLIQRALPDHGRASGGIVDWDHRLHSTPTLYDPRVRLVPVIPHGSPQGKSAHVIIRLFEKRLGVPANLIAKAEDIADLVHNGIDAIVFVDDLLGTGTQFVTEFAIPYDLVQLSNLSRLIYAPLVAHESGVRHIKSVLPQLSVTSAELLGPNHAIFGAEGRTFSDGVNTPEAAWNLYSEILSTRGIVLDAASRRGFGELELAFFFEHAAPDNCLPIFWWNNTPNWKPLFYR